MNTIDKSQVASQSATQIRIAVTYYFQSVLCRPRQGGNQCQGFNTRFFTFDKGPSGQLEPGVDVRGSSTGPKRMNCLAETSQAWPSP